MSGLTRRTLVGQLAWLPVLLGQNEDPLRSLKPNHPRLLLSDSDVPRLLALVRDHPAARKIYQELQRDAEKVLGQPTAEYKLAGPRLLAQSRRVLERVYLLGLLYRLEHRTVYLERALKELKAAAAFKDWNPAHFLDTAEMTHAFAIGYDWLFPELKDDERNLIREAIVTKGLDAALPFYQRQSGWVSQSNNWNIVCNGGIGMGALAVAGEEPEKASAILRYAVDSLPRALASFAPDGGWVEGPAYWHYTSQYAATFLASLDSALGNDFALSTIRGLDRAGRFRVYFTGPLGKTFNYADAGDEVGDAPEMFWMARRFNQPVYAWSEQRTLERLQHAEPQDLLWFVREPHPPQAPAWPLDATFSGVQAAFFRSSWEDPNGIFLAVKGGDNRAPHAHLDLGSFVLDALGVRWALDLGPDSYDLPGYFAKQRTSYYRVKTEAHNTLLIDGENQDPKADAHLIHHEFGADLSWVTIDLSKAFPGKVKLLQRRIGLAQRQAVLIEDRLRSDVPVEMLWGMLTDAELKFDGQSALLTKEGASLAIEIETPRHAVFDEVPTQPPAPQAQNRGTRKLVVRLGEKVTDVELNLKLTPYRTGQPVPKITAKFPPVS